MEGVEPSSYPWEGYIIAVIRHPQCDYFTIKISICYYDGMDKQEQNKKSGGVFVAIFAVILVVLTAGVVAFSYFTKQESYKGEIVSFSFGSGSYFGGYTDYDIERIGSKTARYTAKGYNMSDLDVEKTIDAKYLDELQKIIERNNVAAWDGFDKSDNDIMDGASFTLHVVYENGRTIDAHGYMKYPVNYGVVESEFLDVFDKIGE